MVNVVGLGYIGLPTALMMASHGVEVVGTDSNADLVARLQSGMTTFSEDGLDELLETAIDAGIAFTTEYQTCETYIVCVPTPFEKESKKIDARYVVSAVRSVLEVAPSGATIVIESTVSPGTIDKYIRPLLVEYGREDINLAHAPERVIPSRMIYELLHNDRVIGADDEAVAEQVRDLYACFCQGQIAITDIRTAEMVKVVENTYRDVNIAFANELSKICRSDGMDVHEIIRIANMHPRVNILQPGPGVGGHCISVVPWFLVGDYPGQTRLIRTAREVNDSMPDFVLARAREIMEENGITSISKVGVYGLSFKEDVDDVSDSPTLQMLESMQRHMCDTTLRTFDPWVKRDIVACQTHSLEEFLDGLEMVIVMVGHSAIKGRPEVFGDRVLLDTRNVLGDGKNVYKL